jgi:serine/threonine protein phosphatase PrpC
LVKTQSVIRLEQDRDTAVAVVRRLRFAYRYAYVRARDAREKQRWGEDYLVIHEQDDRLVFALCDGVGQSFKADLGSRLLGESLIQWFTDDLLLAENEAAATDLLNQRLHELTKQASEQIRDAPLSTGLPDMAVKALEQKRAIGTESTFVAGLIDVNNDRLILAWLGDSRLNIWRTTGELVDLDDTFLTSERWSSRTGPVGRPHVRILPLGSCQRILAHSDGLNSVARHLQASLGAAELMTLVNQAHTAPASDDISFFEICFDPHAWAGDTTGTVAVAPLQNLGPSRRPPAELAPPAHYHTPSTQTPASRDGALPVNHASARPPPSTNSWSAPPPAASQSRSSGLGPIGRIAAWLALPTAIVALIPILICVALLFAVLNSSAIIGLFRPAQQMHAIVLESPQPNEQTGASFQIRGHLTGVPQRDSLTYYLVTPQDGRLIEQGNIEIKEAEAGSGSFSKDIMLSQPQQVVVVRVVLIEYNQDESYIVSVASVDLEVAPREQNG